MEVICNFRDGEMGLCVETTRPTVVCVTASVLTLGAFYLDFPESCLEAAVVLRSGFLGQAVSLLAVTIGF